jgi:phenylpropionate dioxygenase-like ring-hydroxylating dioxygenase large terminal subunit
VQREGGAPDLVEVGEVPAERYTSPAHFEREHAQIFARLPQIVAADAELAVPGSRLAVEVGGLSLIIVRGEDGEVRAFRNACRHRSTRLVEPGPACAQKSIVCPYHAWTYDLAGRRVHAPHPESFDGRDDCRQSLVPAHAASRHGFIWASLEPFDVDASIAPIADDLAALDISGWHLYRRVEHAVAGNWKLIVDAFLDGYHIRHLHRDSISRFFLDACFAAEPAGPHIRSLVARKAFLETQPGQATLQSLATPSYLVFPNTILIVHPDYLSLMVAMPVDVGHTRFLHVMLIPKPPATSEEALHWEKSFELIDRGVFVAEDLRIVEAMQRGLETGANDTQLFGQLEGPSIWFHARTAELTGAK